MEHRLKLLSALAAVLVLLLLSAWLLELGPLAPAEDGFEQRLESDAGGEEVRPSAPAAPTPEPAVLGLRGTASPKRDVGRLEEGPPDGPKTEEQPERIERSSEGRQVVRLEASPPQDPLAPDDPDPLLLEAPLTGKGILKSVDRAVAWLRKSQGRNGSWGDVHSKGTYATPAMSKSGAFPAGPTALALYALLEAGQPLKDPVVKRGLAFLHENHKKPVTSMETAMVLLAVTATARPVRPRKGSARERMPKLSARYRSWARKLASSLVEKRTARGWRYNIAGRPESQQVGGPEDLVSTHLATLALFSAHRVGIKAKDRVWEEILRYTLDQQEPAELRYPDAVTPRGFAYILGHPFSDDGRATGGTTACGIANMRMAVHVLTRFAKGRDFFVGSGATLGKTVDIGFKSALLWLETNWSPYANPGKASGTKVLQHHWLWALETAMDLEVATRKLLGEHAWYSEIAGVLLRRQQSDGRWRVAGSWEQADVLDTAFAILFLKRATRRLIAPR